MFADNWRDHWKLKDEPFVHEDADKDPVLAKLRAEAVHSSFDRLFGDPASPVPGIVFGEKGSGKSGLRRMMKRRLEAYNEQHPKGRAYCVEYIDFDPFLECLRRHENIGAGSKKTTPKLLDTLQRADHLDALLSLGITQLVDDFARDPGAGRKLDRRRKRDLLTLTHLYYRSDEQTRSEAVAGLQKSLNWFSGRPMIFQILRIVMTLAGAALLALPHLGVLGVILDRFDGWAVRFPGLCHWAGGFLLVGTWLWTWATGWLLYGRARRTVKAIRVVPGAAQPLAKFLAALPPATRDELALPQRNEDESRYLMLKRLLGVLNGAGYTSMFVLVDRVDESTFLGGQAESMQAFIEPLLEHKLLQFEGVALKLFLPIELSRLTLHASSQELKRMRLDKANTVQELIWTGQELLSIANQRLQAVAQTGGEASPPRLTEFFAPEVREEDLREALHHLGTPRLCFGFLGTLFTEHARDLPEDLGSEDPRWKITLRLFDIQRSAWADRARTLRRTLN
ncbi:MAG: hypothetical protein JKY61_06810 [Planctomycetes bacterium]|nr:hypothetical protein [Planctomycetota bacterium]